MDLKTFRQKYGKTQSQVAVDMQVSLTTVQLWERKVSVPSEENQIKLEDYFKQTEINSKK